MENDDQHLQSVRAMLLAAIEQGEWSYRRLEKLTGIHFSTLHKFATGNSKNPGMRMINAIEKALAAAAPTNPPGTVRVKIMKPSPEFIREHPVFFDGPDIPDEDTITEAEYLSLLSEREKRKARTIDELFDALAHHARATMEWIPEKHHAERDAAEMIVTMATSAAARYRQRHAAKDDHDAPRRSR